MDLSVWAPPCVWQAGRLGQHCHRVVPVFSRRVFGVLGLLMISTSWCSTMAMYGCISGPKEEGWIRNHGGENSCLPCNVTSIYTNYDNIWMFVTHSPICIDISPIAHVALLHTDINSGFKLVPSMGIKSPGRRKESQLSEWLVHFLQMLFQHYPNIPMHGLTCWKEALVRSPSSAKELCRTSGILSWTFKENKSWKMQEALCFHQISSMFDNFLPACTGTWAWGCYYVRRAAQLHRPNLQPVH